MSYRTLLSLLLPQESYSVEQPHLAAELHAEGNALDKTAFYAKQALNGVTPFFAGDLLADWERVVGLTPAIDESYQSRLSHVLAKLSEVGGLSIPYFTQLAANMGYTITIDEFEPFRAGINRAGDTIYAEDIIWVWRVNLRNYVIPAYRFMAGLSVAGERLTMFGDAVIENMFNDLKPAHTYVYFTYSDAEIGLLFYDGVITFDGSHDF